VVVVVAGGAVVVVVVILAAGGVVVVVAGGPLTPGTTVGVWPLAALPIRQITAASSKTRVQKPNIGTSWDGE
jgi:hypothetical protein